MPVIDWTKIDAMSTTEIDELRVNLMKEIQTMKDSRSIVKDEYLTKSREILLLEIEKKDLSISMGKATDSIEKKKNDLEILNNKYWQKRY